MDLNDQKISYSNLKACINEKPEKNKLGFLLLFFIFCFILIMNLATPLIVDDYYVVNINSYADILNSIKKYYWSWGGRIPGDLPIKFFLWKGKDYFNIVNAFMFTVLVMEIYWISKKGEITFSFSPSFILWIFFSLWAFNPSFIDTCLWLSGSSNYLWLIVVVLAFLLPWVRCIYDPSTLQCDSFAMMNGMFFLGVLAGWSHETTIGWLILFLAYYVYLCRKENTIRKWQITGLIGLCLGYGLLIFAPGNFARIVSQTGAKTLETVTSQSAENIFLSSQILHYKLLEIAIILYFHIFLWYVIISFLIKSKKDNTSQIIKATQYVVKVCALTAAGSAIMMFFIPTAGLRPSFLGLVFLTIAAASIFSVQDKLSFSVIHESTKRNIKRIGHIYLILTITLSLWCNCVNTRQWNEVISYIKSNQSSLENTVLEVEPYFTDRRTFFWLIGTGFHLIGMPVTDDELHNNNKLVAKYYGIKGIKKRAVK